jgi:RNA polymerase sigma factor (sigma-70 family)
MKGTSASFGGITGELTVTYKVTYYANWPDENMEENSNVYDGRKIYQVIGNMFDVPSGYEFLGWGTETDGVVVYNEGDVINLSKEINLYAIWGLVEDKDNDTDEELVISYGDTNLDGIVNESDYLLIDSYILDNSVLSGQGLVNADVNIDGKVDNIDVDIIKQVCFGTEGYVGFLPDKPILIYELYIKGESTDKEDTSNKVELRVQIAKLYEKLDTKLTYREREIIKLRYGLTPLGYRTQTQIADTLKISRSYVSRIEKKALSKLKKELNK